MSGVIPMPVGDVPFAPHPRLARRAPVARPVRLSVRVPGDLAAWLAAQCGDGVDPADMIRAILVDAMAEDLAGQELGHG
jgi:hypothetical protein